MGSTRDKLKRRVRKTVKWGGPVLTALLLVVWIGSAWYGIYRTATPERTEAVWAGCVTILTEEPAMQFPLAGWQRYPATGFHMKWWFVWQTAGGITFRSIPLWFPTLLSLLATAAAWRADWKYMRRARVGLCAGCGYDRAGLAAGAVCPECGAAAGA